ncbi:hypothetical protein EBS43_11975 [bacterium]|jgi:hypothetical protein|nr:hypothetical protein [bacterium]
MIEVKREKSGSVDMIFLNGSIEESVSFETIIGQPIPEMHVNCKGISRINSIGVKSWIAYFQTCQKSGTKITFYECSSAIVEQINLISNFLCGGKVDSIFLPYSCKGCKSELAALFPVSELRKLGSDIPNQKCNKCGNVAEFDDIPEEYLGFLTR